MFVDHRCSQRIHVQQSEKAKQKVALIGYERPNILQLASRLIQAILAGSVIHFVL